MTLLSGGNEETSTSSLRNRQIKQAVNIKIRQPVDSPARVEACVATAVASKEIVDGFRSPSHKPSCATRCTATA